MRCPKEGRTRSFSARVSVGIGWVTIWYECSECGAIVVPGLGTTPVDS
jgi:hypothetical protein